MIESVLSLVESLLSVDYMITIKTDLESVIIILVDLSILTIWNRIKTILGL